MELVRIRSLTIFLLIISGFINLVFASRLDFLIPHNEARAQVGVQPLTWNKTLEAYTRWYAHERLEDCDLQHSEGPYGENLAVGFGDQFTTNEAVNMWVGERQNYEYESNSCLSDGCLHYTQVVWRDSLYLGCAKVKCYNDWWFVICNYDPPGNYEGQRPY